MALDVEDSHQEEVIVGDTEVVAEEALHHTRRGFSEEVYWKMKIIRRKAYAGFLLLIVQALELGWAYVYKSVLEMRY